ncbi:MAG: hypothetical protein NWR51_04705 [Akkermansiaceae bacterium]|jgi:hypothetical protein|nr:hypothetical protein [Akkermansiaceae bacterium]MDP4780898.1 hypothetical protein [Akkermansiaceae bacterium]MDP4846544.1 hypothetical protein [Akkermansiaceae bacterium]MDP4899164.1 hypothetical protein [Akkermansiaceae bacterium]
MHISCVRGSPLLRTILVLGVLCISALGFVKLTGGGGKAVEPTVVSGTDGEDAGEKMIPAKVRLTLSCLAGMIDVSAGGESMSGEMDTEGNFLGELEIDTENPVIFVRVACVPRDAGESGRHFAKLVVEAEGQETFTHVFDATGDIDDFVELPF